MKPIFHITKKLLQSNVTRLDSPCKITFAVTYACTFLCKTCNIGKDYLANPQATRKGELTDEEIGKIFKSAKPSWLQITGGEPFMRDIYTILKNIIENDDELYVVHMTTNGFTTQHIIHQVKNILTLKIPRFALTVSIDGFEEDHDEVRGIKDSFAHCIATFRELQKLESPHFNAFISYTSSPHNIGKIELFIQKMQEKYGIDPKYIHMNLYHTSDHFFKNTDQKKSEEYNNKVLAEIAAYRKYKKGNDFQVNFLEHKYAKYVEDFVKTGKSPMGCKALSSSCFLDPFGNVYPCIAWAKKVANVRDFDFDMKKLWDDPIVKETQKNAEHLHCPNCWTPCEAYQTIAGNLVKSVFR